LGASSRVAARWSDDADAFLAGLKRKVHTK
jgi:hypothetical protein